MLRASHLVLLIVAAVGCAKKAPPEVAEPAPAEAEPPAPVEAEPEEVVEAEPEAPASNASLNVTVVRADGSTHEGHVVRVERTEDWYGDDGWTDVSEDLTVTLEGKGTEIQLPWRDIASVDIAYAGSSGVDCTFDSGFTPIMYTCVMGTKTIVKTSKGETWMGADRHKWRFTFDDGSAEEFWIYKLPRREQEEEGAEGPQDTAIFARLQKQLANAVATDAVKRIEVSPAVNPR